MLFQKAPIVQALEKRSPAPSSTSSDFTINSAIKVTQTTIYTCSGCGYTFGSNDHRYVCVECTGLNLCKTCHEKDRSFYSTAGIVNEMNEDSKWSPSYIHIDSAPLPHQFTLETKCQKELSSLVQGQTVYETLQNSFREFKHRRCIGTREKVEVTPQTPYGLGEYKWETYQDVELKSNRFGNGIRQFIDSRSFISIMANNCPEWYYVDLACIWHGIRAIPIHHQSGVEPMIEILKNSETQCFITTNDIVDRIVDVITSGKYNGLKLIIVIDKDNEPLHPSLARLPSNVQYRSFKQILKLGKHAPVPHHPFQPNELCTLGYTSGSTGSPKGVMIYDSQLNRNIVGVADYPTYLFSFQTMAHAQRRFDLKNFFSGSAIGVYSGTMETLFDDIQHLRPATFWGVSRIWNLLHSNYQIILNNIINQNPLNTIQENKNLASKSFSFVLGDRVKLFLTFGALLSDEVRQFIKDCWPNVQLRDIYGFTEDIDIGICVDGNMRESLEYRLMPCPDIGYFPTDKPNPRGELHIKKPTLTKGYYRQPDLTAQSFQDGWYLTGDIVEIVGPRKLKIIDRRKHSFKLANGEFVAPEGLENIFLGSRLIDQILIYGDIKKSFLVAIVIPRSYLLVDQKDKDISKNIELSQIILKEIKQIAKDKMLANYEIPRMIELNNEKWTTSKDLITGSGKLCRKNLYAHYKPRFEAMYSAVDRLQQGGGGSVGGDGSSGSVGNGSNEMIQFIKSILNIDESNGDLDTLSFTQLGGDSLSAIKLSNILKEKTNIQIPASFILNKNNNLMSLTKILEDRDHILQLDGNKVLDWNEECKLDESIRIDRSRQQVPSGVKMDDRINILLTGATGFLGSFILHRLLCQGDRVDKVYCVVRGDKKRLVGQLTNKYQLSLQGVDMSRLVILNGDLSLPLLGLQKDEFVGLSNCIDLIIHNGAVVNMVIPYANLKSTNVGSTDDILRLSCLGSKVIPVSYVSTVGVFSLDENHEIVESTIPPIQGVNTHNGYRQSKLVAEQHIREAKDRGFPIIMFRPGTIYCDSNTGIDNENDLVRMVIRGLMYMRTYPNDMTRHQGGFNMVPVDWVADSIVNLSLSDKSYQSPPQQPLPIYHMTNDTSVPIERLCQVMNDCKMIEMNGVSYETWQQQVAQCTSDNPIYAARHLFSGGFSKSSIQSPQTTIQLRRINLDGCQPITDDILLKNISYLQSLNLNN